MVGLVLVSHSEKLAAGVAELIAQMAPDCPLAVAAGVDDPDHPIGTDAVKIGAAIEKTMTEDGLVILVDLGSAILSAQTALDLLAPELAAKVRIAPAPFVEGALAAAVAATTGALREQVVKDASAALRAKQEALGGVADAVPPAIAFSPLSPDAVCETLTVVDPHGLHARPAARLVAALAPLDAQMRLEKSGRFADPRRLNDIAALQVRKGDVITLYATGKEAQAALQAFRAVVAVAQSTKSPADRITPEKPSRERVLVPELLHGTVMCWQEADVPEIPPLPGKADETALKRAVAQCRSRLQDTRTCTARRCGDKIGEIFAAHCMLLDELAEDGLSRIHSGIYLPAAWHDACSAATAGFQMLEDPYLAARSDDIDDLARAVLWQLSGQKRPQPESCDHPCFLLGDNLLPQAAARLDSAVRAVCLKQGSPFSHAALLCQAAGIVVVPAMGARLAAFSSGDRAVLDIERVTIERLG